MFQNKINSQYLILALLIWTISSCKIVKDDCNNRYAKKLCKLKIDSLSFEFFMNHGVSTEKVSLEIQKLTNIKEKKDTVNFFGVVGNTYLLNRECKAWYRKNKSRLCIKDGKLVLK